MRGQLEVDVMDSFTFNMFIRYRGILIFSVMSSVLLSWNITLQWSKCKSGRDEWRLHMLYQNLPTCTRMGNARHLTYHSGCAHKCAAHVHFSSMHVHIHVRCMHINWTCVKTSVHRTCDTRFVLSTLVPLLHAVDLGLFSTKMQKRLQKTCEKCKQDNPLRRNS